jgi:hypothetical protein
MSWGSTARPYLAFMIVSRMENRHYINLYLAVFAGARGKHVARGDSAPQYAAAVGQGKRQ